MIYDNLTDWYPGSIKPVRAGVYQRRCNGVILYAYFNGHVWSMGSQALTDAMNLKIWIAKNQTSEWRGLDEAPVLVN